MSGLSSETGAHPDVRAGRRMASRGPDRTLDAPRRPPRARVALWLGAALGAWLLAALLMFAATYAARVW